MSSKNFSKKILDNGLRLITIPQKNTQAVTVLVLVGTGSKYESKHLNGISHFLEHMFFKGTKKRPSTMEIAKTLDQIGGIYNAFTSEEHTGYFAKVDYRYWDLALEWVSDIFFNSLFLEEEIEREKGVIIEEINMYQDHPMDYIGTLWSKLLYGDQPAGWPVAGTKESVSKISRQELISYKNKQYTAKNTIVCLAGKIREDLVLSKVKKYFNQIRTNLPENRPVVKEEQKSPQILLNQKQTDQTHLCLGVRAFNIFHPQRYVQEVLATLLGGMMSSRLFIKVRERLGLAYYIHTTTDLNLDTGSLVTQAGLQNDKVEKGIITILKEYQEMLQKKVSFSELKKVKNFIKGKMSLYLENSENQAIFFGLQELMKNKILTTKQIYKEIDKISENDILNLAREIFRSENLNLALIGPFDDKNKFQDILKL